MIYARLFFVLFAAMLLIYFAAVFMPFFSMLFAYFFMLPPFLRCWLLSFAAARHAARHDTLFRLLFH